MLRVRDALKMDGLSLEFKASLEGQDPDMLVSVDQEGKIHLFPADEHNVRLARMQDMSSWVVRNVVVLDGLDFNIVTAAKEVVRKAARGLEDVDWLERNLAALGIRVEPRAGSEDGFAGA